MTITLDGTTGITSPNDTTGNQSYTGTLTGGTGVVNLGSGQFYKDASGNIGIGTTPSDKLDVNGTIRITSGNTVRWVDAGTVRVSIQGDTSSNAIFNTAGSERMRISSGGFVSFNTATNYSKTITNAGSYQAINNGSVYVFSGAGGAGDYFSDRGNTGGDAFYHRFKATASGGWWGYLSEYIDTGTVNSNFTPFSYNGNGLGSFLVTYQGNCRNTNNSYGAISDIKLKENITKAPSYWDKFKQYEFVNYNLIGDVTKTKLLGVVAQQVEKISPSLVDENNDFDSQRNDLGTTTKSVKYSIITLQAEIVLQEAMARIEALEAELQILKGK